MNPVIERLESERNQQVEFIDQTLSRVDQEQRDMVEAETRNLEAARERIRELDAQLAPLREFEELRGAHRESGQQFRPTRGGESGSGTPLARTEDRPYEYRSAGEFLADVSVATARDLDRHRVEQARGRLESNGYQAEANRPLTRAVATQTTADTPGVLPETVRGPVEKDVDAARPFVTSIGVKPLGGIPGKTFHRPYVTQTTQVGEQSGGEKTELPSRKMVIGDVDFTKRTFGGVVNVSRQDIDWTSPSAWDALITDLQEQYALETENAAADDFATAVSTSVTLGTSTDLAAADAKELATALFAAASATYGVVKRVPDTIWASLDVWAKIGPTLVDIAAGGGSGLGTGGQSLTFGGGSLLGVRQVVVPSFASGTLIIGNSSKTEFYEERIGLLSVIEPSILGVEVAYGGYMANGTLKATGFRKIVPHA